MNTGFYVIYTNTLVGRESSVGIATPHGLDGPGIESRWKRDFRHQSRPALGPTIPPIQWAPGLSRGYSGPGRGVDHPPPLALRLKKENSHTFTPPLSLSELYLFHLDTSMLTSNLSSKSQIKEGLSEYVKKS